jgi:hypothetical protein
MPSYTFPADTFAVQGDPQAIREAGHAYGRFATTAGEAAADLRGLDSGSWVGTEGDLFRDRVAEIPPHLDTAHSAFAQVARALGGFAEMLAAAQWQMDAVRADAEQTFRSLRDAYVQSNQLLRDLNNRVGQLEGAFARHLAIATSIQARVQEAARQAGNQIRAAGRTSPTAHHDWFQDRSRAIVLARPSPARPTEHGDSPWYMDVADWLGGRVKDAASALEDVGRSVANFGEYAADHPGDSAELLADGAGTALGVAAMVIGSGGEVGGVVLDATGVGAVAGVPVNIASAGLIITGASIATASAAKAGSDFGRMWAEAQADSSGSSATGNSRLRYEPSPKHGPTQHGDVAPAPSNGRAALDRSVQIRPTSTRRVGVDPKNNEIVIFDETHPGQGVYHGHVRSWSELRPEMQNALRRAGLVDPRGRIIQ